MNSSVDTTGHEGWLPLVLEANDGWRVDGATIVPLAISGGRRPVEFTRAVMASSLVMLPRLVPPMELVNAARPAQLPQSKAVVSMITYGSSRDDVSRPETVGYVVTTLHQLDKMPRLWFRLLDIRHHLQNHSQLPGDLEVRGKFKTGERAS